MPVDLFSPLICRESRWRENAAYLVTSIANLYQGIYSETGFHYGVERNFIWSWCRPNGRSQVIEISLCALISRLSDSGTIPCWWHYYWALFYLFRRNFCIWTCSIVSGSPLISPCSSLISRFNLSKSFNYTPYLFYMKCFKSEITSVRIWTQVPPSANAGGTTIPALHLSESFYNRGVGLDFQRCKFQNFCREIPSTHSANTPSVASMETSQILT